jgi:hypothetical protein
MRLAFILLTAALWAADAPKPVVLTVEEQNVILRLQLRSARVDAAKLQIAAEEKSVNEALKDVVSKWQAKGCLLQDDLTCQAKAPEAKPAGK